MGSLRRAVVDVGTNSVKLLVAEVTGQTVKPVIERSDQTRLGRGFYETHRLQFQAITQTAAAVARYVGLAAHEGVSSIRVIATSAARDASNADELLSAIHRSSARRVEVISGDQEAEWVFRGVMSDPKHAGQRLLILDVGGGSTEFILGEGAHHLFRQSFDLGSVRLLEKLRPGDPPSLADLAGCRSWLKDFFNEQMGPKLESLLRGAEGIRLIGTGGTTTILARMEGRMEDFNRDRIEATCFSRQTILEYMVHLWSLPVSERKKIVGLPPKRADIIPFGVAIYEAVMEHFQFVELHVSTRGLRFGALLDEP
jgi:exopolyphosphatase/guanosine-5'-triphosphate,3'-diphosphate pyrophosphatase